MRIGLVAWALLAFGALPAEETVSTTVRTMDIANVLGVRRVDSTAEFLPLAVPYGEVSVNGAAATNTAIFVTNVVFTANLFEGDRLYAYDHAAERYNVYELDERKRWQPQEVYTSGTSAESGEAASDGAMQHDWGYGFWLYRPNVAARTGEEQAVFLAGQVPVGAVKARVLATRTEDGKTVKGKTLLGNPYLDTWDLNDFTVFNWREHAVKYDRIQLEGAGNTLVFEWKPAKEMWVCTTSSTNDAAIPAGRAFWYVRGTTGTEAFDLTFDAGLTE